MVEIIYDEEIEKNILFDILEKNYCPLGVNCRDSICCSDCIEKHIKFTRRVSHETQKDFS